MTVMPQTPTRGLPEGWFRYPAVARVESYLMGERDNYEVDRHVALLLLEAAPWLRDMTAINKRHRPHAVTVLARELGITQFLDLGCGLPARWNRKVQRHEPAHTAEAAQDVHSEARVVYVDNDPMVCAHAKAFLDTNGATAALQADICKIDELLDHATVHTTLDRDRPIAVLAHDLLPWVSDEVADTAMEALRDWLPPGSAISVTHASTDKAPEAMTALVDHYAKAGISYRPRPLDRIQALLGPWDLLPPGLVLTAQWRAGNARRMPRAEHSFAYAAIVTNTATPNEPRNRTDLPPSAA
ncbi:SAM-dependent methyltransferase [Streptomyces sp. NPDC050546]|uniref:SAM-dependent methyltransferase n=1 Tax=Streptomyces sp. NPDC050546 TaxID=3365628 RepID=UPI0037BC64D7